MESDRRLDEIPNDDEINRILFRGDDEMKVFMDVDREILEECKDGKKRLMGKDEVPRWVLEGSQVAHAEASMDRRENLVMESKRERKETFYSERLCETKRAIAVLAALLQTSAKERGLVFVFPR